MKIYRSLLIIFTAVILTCSALPASAQCAMCSAQVETNAQNGNTSANGLNNGIMYLLAMPYIAVAVLGYVWYKKYRRKNIDLNMRDEKFNLN